MSEKVKKRECGECRACCTVLEVDGVPEPKRSDPLGTLRDVLSRVNRGEIPLPEMIHNLPWEPGFDDMIKPAFTPCHWSPASGPGCSIYKTRPRACREWECMWLKGLVPKYARPTLLGIVLDRREIMPGHVAWVAHEYRKGAFGEKHGKQVLGLLAESELLLLVWRNAPSELRGPPEILERACKQGQEILEEKARKRRLPIMKGE